MKKIIRFTLVLSVILLFTTSANKRTTYNFYVDNGTNWDGTVIGYGAIYAPYPGTFYGTSGQYLISSLNPSISYITVTVNCSAPGTHTYGLTGGVSPAPTPIVSSTGSATFTNVNVVAGDIGAYIY